MSIRNTVAADFKIVDGTQAVTFAAVRESATTPYTVAYADAHDLTEREINASNGVFQVGDRRWGVDASEIPGVRPRRGDTITDTEGTVWTLIGDATTDALGISWFCPTRRGR